MDPITLAIVGALANLGSSVIKDSYEALKAAISQKFGVNSDISKAVENLQQKPESAGRKETLSEEVANAQANKDAELMKLVQVLVERLDSLASSSQPSIVINQKAGDNSIQIGKVDRDVNINLSTYDRRIRAETKTEEGRQKVQEWGQRISHSGWDEQAWHLLGFALQFTHEAVEVDPDYQRAWTLMADIYHRIGKDELAKRCLKKSYDLATPGPNHPGGFYKEVENNIRSAYPFNSSGGLKRQSPPVWFDEKYQKYWTL